MSVAVASDLAWSLTHLDAWRHLVIARGWAGEDFASTQIQSSIANCSNAG
jgi:hypothetical protein